MDNKKALIIGASGALGKELTKELSGFMEVIGTYNSKEDSNINLDITDKNQVKKVIEDVSPDYVFLLSALTNVGYCEEHKEEAWKINVEGTKNVLDSCNKNSKLIFISTDAVFSESLRPYSEDDPKDPKTYYGYTKSVAEDMVLSKKNSLILRTSRLFGKSGKKFINNLLDSLLRNEEVTLPKENFGNPTFMPSLAKAIRMIVQKDLSGIYHAVSNGVYSLPETANEICKIFEIKNPKITLVDKDFFNKNVRRQSVILSTTKLNKENIFVEGLREGLIKIKNG